MVMVTQTSCDKPHPSGRGKIALLNVAFSHNYVVHSCTMKRRQGFRYALRPNGKQLRLMRRFVGSCRFVFNKGLALQQGRYANGETKISYGGLCQLVTAWRHSPDTAWLAEAPIHPLQQALNGHSSLGLKRRAGMTRFATLIPAKSNSIRSIVASFSPSSAGCATATAEW